MSESIDGLVTYCTQAMVASLSSQTSTQDRQQHQQFLEQLLASQQCSVVLQSILASPADDPYGIKILSLSMLHDWIKRWWNKIDANEHLGIRTFCASILQQPVVFTQSSNFRSKLSAILAEIGERQYPQNWPTMMPELLAVWLNGPIDIQEIILKTITFIYVDCTDNDYSNTLPTARRQELLAGLKSAEAQLLALLYQFLATHVQSLMQAVTDSDKAISIRAVSLSLSLLHAMSTIIPLERLIEPSHNFLPALGAALSIEHIQVPASACLLSICSHKMPDETAYAYTALLADCLQIQNLPADANDRFVLTKNYLSTISSFLTCNASKLMGNVPSHQIDKLLGYSMQAMHTEGRRATGNVLQDWSKMFRDESVQKYEHAGGFAKALLDVYFSKGLKPAFLQRKADEEEWFSVEFDDLEDWQDFYGVLLGQLTLLVGAICTHHASIAASFILAQLQALIGVGGGKTAELQLLARYLSGYVDHLAHLPELPHGAAGQTQQLLDMVLAWQPDQQHVLETVRLLGAFAPLATSLASQGVLAALSYLFSLLEGVQGQEVQEEAGRCFAAWMKKAATSLGHGQLLEQILQQTSQTLSKVTSPELQTSLRQSMVSLLPSISSTEVISFILQLSLQPYLDTLIRAVNSCFSDVNTFITHLSTSSQETIQLINLVKHTVKRCTGVISKVEHQQLAYGYWSSYIQLCTHLLTIFTHPQLLDKGVHGLTALDAKRLLSLPMPSPPLSLATQLANDTSELLQHLYRTLGLAAKGGMLYNIDSYVAFQRDVLLPNLPQLPHPVLGYMIRQLWEFLLLHAPSNASANARTIVQKSIQQVMQHMLERLSLCWAPSSSMPAVYAMEHLAPSLTPEQLVSCKEGMLRELTRIYSDVLSALGGCKGPLALSSTDTPEAEAAKAIRRDYLLEQLLLGDQRTCELLLCTLQMLLGLADSLVAGQALQLLTLLLDKAQDRKAQGLDRGRREVLQGWLAGPLFQALLATMLKQERWLVGGLEHSYSELLLQIYAVFVLQFDKDTLCLIAQPAQPVQDANKADKGTGKKNMTSWASPPAETKKQQQCVVRQSTAPRELLLSTQLLSIQEAQSFEQQLLAQQGKKKAQRALLRELLAQMLRRGLGDEQLQLLGSSLAPVQSKIKDLSSNNFSEKNAKERQAIRGDYGSADVGGLFAAEDDPDL